VALFLVSRVMRELPASIAYPLWAGGGTAGVALLGERTNPSKLAGIVLVVAGMVLLNLAAPGA